MKVSYGRALRGEKGIVYTQRIAVTRKEFEVLRDAVLAEIAMGYPHKAQYCYDIDLAVRFFKPLKEEGNICFLTISQTEFMRKYKEIKERLKTNQNTYIEIIK